MGKKCSRNENSYARISQGIYSYLPQCKTSCAFCDASIRTIGLFKHYLPGSCSNKTEVSIEEKNHTDEQDDAKRVPKLNFLQFEAFVE